jgi:hypothetical protein
LDEEVEEGVEDRGWRVEMIMALWSKPNLHDGLILMLAD